jgi:fatty acid desaturase
MFASNDRLLQQLICRELPSEAFEPHPWRALLAIPLFGLIIVLNVVVIRVWLPAYAALLISVLLGCAYGSLMFLGHEISHGATVKSPLVQDMLLYPAFAVFFLSPHGWRVWHQSVHHAFTNISGIDPDTFGTLNEYNDLHPSRRFWHKFAPGSGHWLSSIYLFLFFTFQAQGVLWSGPGRGSTAFQHLNRRRVAVDTLATLVLWSGLSYCAGIRGFVYAVVIPMLAANFTVMSYIVTNHMLRPMVVAQRHTLKTTMSVTTLPILDKAHFYFSHHVEHHLFPAMSSRYYPLIRRILHRHAAGEYLAPSHWKALIALYCTPRVYAVPTVLVDPRSGRRVLTSAVEAALRDCSRRDFE